MFINISRGCGGAGQASFRGPVKVSLFAESSLAAFGALNTAPPFSTPWLVQKVENLPFHKSVECVVSSTSAATISAQEEGLGGFSWTQVSWTHTPLYFSGDCGRQIGFLKCLGESPVALFSTLLGAPRPKSGCGILSPFFFFLKKSPLCQESNGTWTNNDQPSQGRTRSPKKRKEE